MRSATYATVTTFLCIFVTFCGVSIYKSYAPLSTGRAQAAAVGGVACSSLRGAGSADSCKMPNLSHTLPNCQHSLAGCLFICFAHGLHDLINTPAKLQRPLTPHCLLLSRCCPLLAFPATLQLRLENFFLSLHTHATCSHSNTHTHTQNTHTLTFPHSMFSRCSTLTCGQASTSLLCLSSKFRLQMTHMLRRQRW